MQGESGRGSLDDRIGGGVAENTRGKQYTRNKRDEQLSYDDKPAFRAFEERVNVDNRTLEERISGATPTSTKKFSYSIYNEGNINKPGNNNSSKQGGKKAQNKAQKQTNRNQGSMMLTEPQLQEETNGGVIVQSAGGARSPTITVTATTADEVTSKHLTSLQGQQPTTPLEGDMDTQQVGQLEAPSACVNTPSPISTSLQEQLRERALASMKKKAQVAARENDDSPTSTVQKAVLIMSSEAAIVQTQAGAQFDVPSALNALEQSLNGCTTKRSTDPERDAAVDAMLAEAQASSGEKKSPHKKAVKDEGDKVREERDSGNGAKPTPQTDHTPKPVQGVSTPKPIPNVADRKPTVVKEAHIGDKNTRNKEVEMVRETDDDVGVEGEQKSALGLPSHPESKQKEKVMWLSPLQISTSISHSSVGRPSYRQVKSAEDDDEVSRRENFGPYSAPLLPYTPGYNRHPRDLDDMLDPPESGPIDLRPRFWEDRNSYMDREYKNPHGDLRRRPERRLSRSQPKEPYREDLYRNDGLQEGLREPYYAPQRIPPLPSPARALLPAEEYRYPPPEYSYGGPRYLPIRGEEHFARQPDYDSYYKDLAEWLEITGFHDIDYRQSALRRHRERELDRLYAMRAVAASAAAREEEATSSIDRRVRGGSALMLPPQVPVRAEGGISDMPLRGASRVPLYQSRASLPPPQAMRSDDRLPSIRFNEGPRNVSPGPESAGLKRKISADNELEGLRPEKTSRVTYERQARPSSPRPEDENLEHRGARIEPTEGGMSRRDTDLKEQNDNPLPPARRMTKTSTPTRDPVRGIQGGLANRSPSPNKHHENECRRASFMESGTYRGRLIEDEQSSSGSKVGRRPYEKPDRRVASPDSSPKQERNYTKQARYNINGKFNHWGGDNRPGFGHGFDGGFRSPAYGNFNRRKGSFEDPRARPGYFRGGGDFGRDGYNKSDRREKFLARNFGGPYHPEADPSANTGEHALSFAPPSPRPRRAG